MNLNYQKLIRDQVLEQVQAQINNDGAWYEIQNAEGDDDEPAKIRIYGVIGESFWFKSVSAADFVEQLDQITASEIHVLINSVGGSAWDAIAIYNALRSHSAHVTTKVEGVAFSAASLIVQAGDDRVMLGASQMMIHNAWTISIGSADYMRETAAILDKQDEAIAGIYANRSGKPKAHFLELMAEETWFTDDETVTEGLADSVEQPPRQSKPFDNTPPSDVEDLIRRAVHASHSDDRKTKFTEQAQSVLTEVRQLIDRTEKVVAFRTDQGKPPLSEDSVELFAQLTAAHQHLSDVLTSHEKATTEPDQETIDEIEDIYVRLVEGQIEEETI